MNVARKPIIAGNWKMNKGTAREAAELTTAILSDIGNAAETVDVVLCPPYTALYAVREVIGSAQTVAMGAQDTYWKATGAYTGRVSPEMLVDAGVRYVILGHSETRGRFGVPEPDFTPDVLKHFGETDVTVNRKTKASIAAGLTPIICVGETLGEREHAHTDMVVAHQVKGALDGVESADVARLVFAYEPVWAIGTGKTCDADEANRVCGIVRSTLATLYDDTIAETVRIQYGGSMKPDNAPELLSRPEIDGGLIGGASLKAADFAAIIATAAHTHSAN